MRGEGEFGCSCSDPHSNAASGPSCGFVGNQQLYSRLHMHQLLLMGGRGYKAVHPPHADLHQQCACSEAALRQGSLENFDLRLSYIHLQGNSQLNSAGPGVWNACLTYVRCRALSDHPDYRAVPGQTNGSASASAQGYPTSAPAQALGCTATYNAAASAVQVQRARNAAISRFRHPCSACH